MSDAQDKATTIETKGSAVIAKPQKKMLNDEELKSMAQSIDKAAGEGAGISVVVIDLSAVSILPSLGLGILVQVVNKCKARQQKIKLSGVQPQVRQVFSITKLDRLFEFTATVDAAIS